MATFAAVLKSGGRYHPGWVEALHAMVREHGPRFDQFAVLTDINVSVGGVTAIPLLHNWPGWWSKIEAFRPGLFEGTVVLADLDVVISASIDRLAEPGMTIMEDFLLPGRASTPFTRWTGDEMSFVYEAFCADQGRWMRPGSCGPVPNAVHGDQVVVDHLLRRAGAMPPFIQSLYPGLLELFDATRGVTAPVTVFIGDVKPFLKDGRLVAPTCGEASAVSRIP